MKKPIRIWVAVMAVGLTSLGHLEAARAEEVFPGALREAADMECVPSCLMCHTDDPGTKGTWAARQLPRDLSGTGKLKPGARDVDAFKAAYAHYALSHPEEVAKIKRGLQPETGQDVCAPSYGCGASIAQPGVAGLHGGAALALVSAASMLLVRRRRRSRSPSGV